MAEVTRQRSACVCNYFNCSDVYSVIWRVGRYISYGEDELNAARAALCRLLWSCHRWMYWMCCSCMISTSYRLSLMRHTIILDGKYSERVQIPAKANNRRFTELFDRYFHIPLPIVTKHELGLPFPPGNLPIKLGTNPSTFFLVIVVTDRQTNTHTQTDKPTPVKTYFLAFAGIIMCPLELLRISKCHKERLHSNEDCQLTMQLNITIVCSKAASTPATMSKQRSTLSKQHSTLLPKRQQCRPILL